MNIHHSIYNFSCQTTSKPLKEYSLKKKTTEGILIEILKGIKRHEQVQREKDKKITCMHTYIANSIIKKKKKHSQL